ncbi:Fasciclin-2 [Halotydeus destructor]|nr:Fasciclin-2 [Halotydeus destructor]
MSNGARWPLNGHHSITRSLAGSMTRKTVTVSFLLIILNLTSLVTYIEAQAPSGPRLVILPNEAVIRRPVNKAFVVTCKGDNAEPSLFTDLKWLDANGDEINSNYQNQKIRVSKESERLLLTFYDPTSNDGGQYVCSGTFQESELLKRAVDVSFYQDITFEDCPDSQSLVKGSSGVVIRCSVFANPPPIITWTKNGAGLSQGTQGQKYIIENNGIQVKGAVSEDDAGRYDVSARVEDTGAVEYRFITVEVHVAPEIREVKQDKNATEGEEVTLTCHATGVPAPQYTWFDPQRRNLSTVGGYQVDRDRGTVSIMKVKRLEDNGKFTCEASNAAGKIQYEYKVDVITRPVITSFENTTAIVGSDGSLECRATGLPAPELTIRKDGEEEALFNGKNGAKLDLGTKDDETILKVTLSPTSRAHDGLYYCSASNLGGRADRVGHLTVHFKPDLSQTKLDVKTWDAQPANLLCNVAAIPNATVNWWFRGNEIYADNSNPTYRVTGTNDGSVLHVRPHGTPGAGGADVYGNYRCIARNVLGESMVEIQTRTSQSARTSWSRDVFGKHCYDHVILGWLSGQRRRTSG